MTFGWKKFQKAVRRSARTKNETINGDTKASVSKEREVEIC